MLKSFLSFINESDEMITDLDRMLELGLIDQAEYFTKLSSLGKVPPGWREVAVGFEFDWTWADQTETEDALQLMHRYFDGFGEDLPTGCWVDPESIEIDEMGWGLEWDLEDDYREPDYDESASGGMTMFVPDEVSDHELSEWADSMTGRIFSYFWIEGL